jgi:hypothetical protein
MTKNLMAAGAGQSPPPGGSPAPALVLVGPGSPDGDATPAPPVPPACIRCGGLERDHLAAFHSFVEAMTCISCCILPASVIHHGYAVCGGCALDGVYGSVLVP